MRKFIINVNGKSYEVEVEEIVGSAPAVPRTPAPTAPVQAAPAITAAEAAAAQTPPVAESTTTASKPNPEPEHPSTTAGNLGSLEVSAPMPGTILDIKVNAGDTIKKGQVVLILEAMKMENEIMAPEDGKITSINTSKGASVNSGDLLFTMN